MKYIYATLSAYAASSCEIDRFLRFVRKTPTRRSVSNNGEFFSAHYSSEDVTKSNSAEDHARSLIQALGEMHEVGTGAGAPGVKFILWFYAELDGANSSLRLSPQVISWAHRIEAEICVDVWAESSEEKSSAAEDS